MSSAYVTVTSRIAYFGTKLAPTRTATKLCPFFSMVNIVADMLWTRCIDCGSVNHIDVSVDVDTPCYVCGGPLASLEMPREKCESCGEDIDECNRMRAESKLNRGDK